MSLGLALAAFLLFGLIAGLPLFLLMGVVAVLCYSLQGNAELSGIVEDIYFAADKEILLAIPLFILAGNLMTQGAIAKRLIRIASALTAPLPAGLGVAAVLSCTLFAAISGSSPVTLIAIGTMMYPALVQAGYKPGFAVGLLASAGTLGIIIPPSIPMIVYSIMANVPVTDMFIGGVLPGLLLASLLMIYAMIHGRGMPRGRWSGEEFLVALKTGFLSLVVPVIILGGIYSGFFTATEAAAIAVFTALVIELGFYRELTVPAVWKAMTDTTQMLGMIFFILLFAVSFNKFLIIEQVPQGLVEDLSAVITSKTGFLVGVNLLLLAAGCFMDIMSAILVFAPLLTPMAVHYGIDPVHFGIIMIVNLEIGYLTPPVGINLFVASAAFKQPLGDVIRATLRPMLMLLAGLALVTFWPALSLTLVHLK
ncbi:MAG: putative rane protein [Pseudomonadota bacterium]|jgi:C4-dicarboxylate transporter DctM subunit